MTTTSDNEVDPPPHGPITADPFLVPIGWRSSRLDGIGIATRPGASPARLEWRIGATPDYDGLTVEDEDSYELAGHPVHYRRFGHRDGGAELLSEEWTWQLDGTCVVLTGTVARDDYLSVCDLFEDVASTLAPEAAVIGVS